MTDEFEDDDFDAQFDDETPEEETQTETEVEEESHDTEEEQDFDKPVSEGDVVEVEVDDLGSKGDGIARVEGFVVFVPGGEVGETYEVEVNSVGNKFGFAEITE